MQILDCPRARLVNPLIRYVITNFSFKFLCAKELPEDFHTWKTSNFKCLWRISILLLMKLIPRFWIALLVHWKCMQYVQIWFSCTDINAKTIDDSPLQKVTNCNYSNNTVHHRSSISDYGCCIQCTILNYYLYIKNLYLYVPHGKWGLKIPCNVPYVSFCNFIILIQKINEISKK